MSNKRIAVVGAGFSGAVVARELAQNGFQVTLFDERSHVAGNCHTSRDLETGVMVHVYGPHIFHTNNEKVWNYIRQFDEFMPFVNRVKAVFNDRVYSLPINLLTINTFFGKNLNPIEAQAFLKDLSDLTVDEPVTFEQQALKFVGRELYEAFFKSYTIKQWGMSPTQLPASILKRLPVRFNYDDNYYSSKYQGIPKNGYTYIVENIIRHKNITLHLNSRVDKKQLNDFDHIFYSGPIDAWFNHSEGRLAYRTLKFEAKRFDGDYQGNAVMNYCDMSVPWTRISEHKHFSPWETHEKTIIYKEYSSECDVTDIPYYPIRQVKEKDLLDKYIKQALQEKKVTFLGRLGTYRYLDMHVTIAEALDVAAKFMECSQKGGDMPVFNIDPLA